MGRGKRETEEEVERLIEEILAEAERAAEQIDVERLARQVLAEARIIARWDEKPFYIS